MAQLALLLTLDRDTCHGNGHSREHREDGRGHDQLDQGEAKDFSTRMDHLFKERLVSRILHEKPQVSSA